MQNNTNENEKLLAADIIEDVILKKYSIKEGLEKFPKNRDDIDLKCAFDALFYLEADEDIRKKDADYATIQDEYLLDIAGYLKENKAIPKNIVEQYQKYNKDNLIGDYDTSFKGIMKKIKRMINF